ncbi:MAG: cysteine synthase A [Desulfobulbaceae bacterium]|jgi:cysteine synthase A|nr:cysteine synthase A [Desulfobulbaceae bacterium]
MAYSLIDSIGNTPLVALTRLGGGAHIFAKQESRNPLGSVKCRVAAAMIEAAEKSGALRPGGLVIEPTSGNTGLGLAWVSVVKGYKLILTMPESMSIERRKLLAQLGAELIVTSAREGMAGAVARAKQLVADSPGAFMPDQFANPENPAAHRRTTGPEIWRDLDGQVDALVAGVGTGGTITGCGQALKEKNPNLHVVAVEPTSSPVLSGGKPGPHGIQGIGAGFIPKALNVRVIDRIITVSDSEALATARELAKKEGILAGISSGAAVFAARRLAALPEFIGKNIVCILPDTGERYLSTALFE